MSAAPAAVIVPIDVAALCVNDKNKEFADVANQLRLFLSDDDDLGVRPERWLRD